MSHWITWEEALTRCSGFLTSIDVTLDNKDVLLAVSGGMDSMFMLALLATTRARLSVAHVNYGLRGAESDADAALVKSTCTRMGIPFHEKEVDVKSLAEESDESLQQAGRRIRYTWFEELCDAHHYDYICTAHHQDDATETFFINLLRGTGLKGLTGIPAMRDKILRPILCFTRAEISELVRTQEIVYRHDASNFGRDYLRNRIRHDIIPLLQKERSQFISRMQATQHRLADEYALLQEFLHKLTSEICDKSPGAISIDRERLVSGTSPAVVLLFLIQEYGFSMAQCEAIISSTQISGSRYLSPSHELILDRNRIIVVEQANKTDEVEIHLEGDGRYMIPNGELIIHHASFVPAYSDDPNTELIDASKITGALMLRHWQSGDFFYPFGGSGRQKLQDYFTNEKLSMIDKANVWLLTAENEIVWVVGMRLDHRYRVTPQTNEFVTLGWKPADA